MKRDHAAFFQVGGLWLVISLGLLFSFGGASGGMSAAIRWFFLLFFLSMADLVALFEVLSGVLGLMAGETKNQMLPVIRTSSWGAIKLACIGILGMVLYHGKAAPVAAVLLGLGTLVVVPLIGGLWWYQRNLKHA